MADALWQVMSDSNVDLADMLVFLPSRRAVRTVEKMIVEKMGGVAILPMLVALGSGPDDAEDEQICEADVISNTERVVVLAKLLAADANVGNLNTALDIAHDLVRMQDYMENEGVRAENVDWINLVDEKYAAHFQGKAQILRVLSDFMPKYANGRITKTAARNRDIRAWINKLDKYKLVVVCASTASVPATADLMCAIAQVDHGRIILSGKISGREEDFILNTNPYNAEYKFLKRLGVGVDEVRQIDVGESNIDFMNWAFGNDCEMPERQPQLKNCHLVEVGREATEAEVVAEIASRAVKQKKSVLVISPDAAGNQRIDAALQARGIDVDFSGGISGPMTNVGRAVLNLFDAWIENDGAEFDKLYAQSNGVLIDTFAKMVDLYACEFEPQIKIDDPAAVQIWLAIRQMSDALVKADVKLTLGEARVFVADAIAGVSVRNPIKEDVSVVVLGTIESRMQTADVVVLSGLNDGMFPSQGYENSWLPRGIAEKIGLPSPDRKVSLQALDFMNLSCGADVYWIRSKVAGGVQTAESRFVSRVIARRGNVDMNTELLDCVLNQDVVPHRSLDYSVPVPPPDWSDVYVTELELLIHNPYAFYVKHILRLSVLDDYWVDIKPGDFGILVHDVAEHATDLSESALLEQMRMLAAQRVGTNSILWYFWDKRFREIAPKMSEEFLSLPDAQAEKKGTVKIAGRNVCARADRFWDGGVLDIKTGSIPSKTQLENGRMPQLPLEAYILQQGGFPIKTTVLSQTPIMKFLHLKNHDVQVVPFTKEETEIYMRAAINKTIELFNMYSAGGAGYEYYDTGDKKYEIYDDLARNKD